MSHTEHNLYAQFQSVFLRYPDRVAIETDTGEQTRFADIDQVTGRMANWLQAQGLQAGDRVMVQVEKSVTALLLYLACLRAGMVYVPLNTAYQATELAYFIENAGPRLFVCDPARESALREIIEGLGVEVLVSLGAAGEGSLTAAVSIQAPKHSVCQVVVADLAAILYTSGTTGRSKGAQLTHGNLLSNAQTLLQHWDWQADDVLIHALPVFHVHGLFVAAHCAMLNGSKMLWMSKFQPAKVLEWLPQATVFMGVPTLYVRLLQESALTQVACRHMRLFISGSAPLLTETFSEWRERTGHTILERYGMSETVMLTSNPCRAAEGERKGGTVGRALPGVLVRCVDEHDEPIPVGEIGAIQVQGPNVFPGYWHMPEANAKEFTADGWFRTGDVGRFDADGYLSIVGRSKDLIITGGYNVYPAEVEGYINDLAGVAESAVIGCPHSDFGEGVVAVVVPRPGASLDAEQLTLAIKSQIASFKVPKRLFVVHELPRNVMGKVQKNLLRDSYAKVFEGT